eukprot:TRINITY_DN3225_c0_g2_i2.p1 TRINITY_DN3225_c0_g2~~TRINITY_DN3225_c0_g2_i2.p1  ORF type:complete len:561 (+),score=47.73 TRINITY_DN3225_c0_g2_i2:33-1715(+)
MVIIFCFVISIAGFADAYSIPADAKSSQQYSDALRKAHARVQKDCPREANAVMSKRCQRQASARQFHAFNQQVSDRLALDRAVPDTRPRVCGSKDYNVKSTVSVIIPFHHEATSTLLRTAASVLKRTPDELLKEVILVNDGADAPWAAKQRSQLAKYAEKHSKVRVLTMEQHLGLAPAKVAGARVAKGDIVAFLDSHCEANIGWYEPLAAAIEEDSGTIANPIIDGISSEDFSYRGTNSYTRGVFTWGMYYAGEPFNDTDAAALTSGEYAATPAMPGGLFAVDRLFFEKLGFYDEGLRVWGGENIELSLKAWRCGGRVIFVPSSRVGHVYKSVGHRFPPGESLHKNYKRIAEVWLDDYRHVYYKSFPRAAVIPAGDLTLAHSVRKRLQCKSMEWFITNVFPTLFIPAPVIAEGMLQSGETCVSTAGVEIASNPMQHPHVSPAQMQKCSAWSDHNQWYFMQGTKRLVHIGIWTEECLGARGSDVVVCQCARYPHSGCAADEIEWKLSENGRNIVHAATGLCLQYASSRLLVAECHHAGASQQEWTFLTRSIPKTTGGNVEL